MKLLCLFLWVALLPNTHWQAIAVLSEGQATFTAVNTMVEDNRNLILHPKVCPQCCHGVPTTARTDKPEAT